MTTISVKSNVKQARRRLKHIHRRQIPFATSQALNDTAFLIRTDTVTKLWPASVNVKQRNFARAAFRVQKANKRRLQAAVFDRLDRQVFKRQIRGGLRLPYSSTHLAIPTHNALTRTGRIKKIARLSDPNVFERRGKGGRRGLWRRTRKGIVLLYNLERRAIVPKSFPFFERGRTLTERHFNKFLGRRLRRAIATAR